MRIVLLVAALSFGALAAGLANPANAQSVRIGPGGVEVNPGPPPERREYAPEPSIRIEAHREDKILADVRELCEFWIAEARDEKRDRAVPSEMERVYRNMAGLVRPRDRDRDPVQALIQSDTEVDGLMFDIAGRLNLSGRTRTELLYREDHDADQSEADWL